MEYIRSKIPSFFKHATIDNAYFLKETGHFMTHLTKHELKDPTGIRYLNEYVRLYNIYGEAIKR